MIVTKLIFFVLMCTLSDGGCHIHHAFNQPKISKISATPQTRNPHAIPSEGQPLVLCYLLRLKLDQP